MEKDEFQAAVGILMAILHYRQEHFTVQLTVLV